MVWNIRAIYLAVGMACVVAAAPASAQMVEARNPSSLVDALKAGGYPAELKKDGSGDPMIVTSSENRRMGVVFYGCTNNVNCTYVSFYFGVTFDADDKKMSAQQIADWNKSRRFGRLSMDDDGSISLKHEVDLDKGGMSRALFIDSFEWFSAAVTTVAMAMKQ